VIKGTHWIYVAQHQKMTLHSTPEAYPSEAEFSASGSRVMSLRMKINLVFSVLTFLLFAILIVVQVVGTRNSVREEMEASGRIATQLLTRISSFYSQNDLPGMINFLSNTGRVRANDIRLYDQSNHLLYQSPPSIYKAGRNAPEWYAALVAPSDNERVIQMSNARLVIQTNPTRAVLDGWDNLLDILFAELILFLLADLLILWLVGRWLEPLEKVQHGLRELGQGDHKVRLPPLPGKEAGEMGRAFNRMAQAVEDNIQVRQASAEAQARLDAQRDFTKLLHARIEEERAALALELHDELGQSLTAIRSIAKSLMQHPNVAGSPIEQHANMLFDTAGMTSDAMHRMIPRLRPIKLEGMGLVDAVRDLLTQSQQNTPNLRLDLAVRGKLSAMADELELTAYRIVQEAVTNIIRHAQASRAHVTIEVREGQLHLSIADNGIGAQTLKRDGHYGVRGMQERAESHGGMIDFRPSKEGGLEVQVVFPLKQSSQESGKE
jgi:two-component system sensor histidine kinase UhpB